MNYVQLVDRLKTEAGVAGATLVTLASQVAEINRLANWINAAWVDVQEAHDDWFFLRQPYTFNTVAGQFTYTPAQAGIAASPGLSDWKRDSARIYSTALGVSNEMIVPYIPYDDFRNLFQYGSMRTTQMRPTVYSVDPSLNLVLGAVPDGIYTMVGEYFQQPLLMAADTDVPVLPARYHMLIVYRAMMHYGLYEAAPEVFQRGQNEFGKMMSRLQQNQLPDMTFGPSLA